MSENSMKILEALNDIDSRIIMDAEKNSGFEAEAVADDEPNEEVDI